MVPRQRKKKNKLRGKRTHGKGDTKNKRGAGCRGGRGKAGSHKHKYSKYYDSFGKFNTLKAKRKDKALNLGELERLLPEWVEKKIVEKKEGLYFVDGLKTKTAKILSRGEIKSRIAVRNAKVSKKARAKIEKAGGRIEEKATEEKKEETGKEKKEAKEKTEK